MTAILCGALTFSGCGGDEADEPDRFGAIPKRTIQAPDDETAPRWEQIATLRGSAGTSRRVSVSRPALQWRIRWRCEAGRMSITVKPPPANSDGRAAGSCPGRGSATWVGTGTYAVAARASANYRVIVEQELRTPLREPPPGAVRSGDARELARGRFAGVELKGRGTAVLYRLPSGRLALRLADFGTEPNPDLDVWLSEEAAPTTTRRVFRAPYTRVRSLKATLGDQNYLLPSGADERKIRSVVVLNAEQRVVYAAAKLAP